MRMLKKAKFLLVLISLSICLCIMSSTYSRYVAGTTGNINALVAKWQILVSNTDITDSSVSEIEFTPIIEENEHVKENVIAPSSKGYFDIAIDPSNVDVSFKYTIDLEIANETMPDIIVTKYAMLPTGYIEGDPLEPIDLETFTITNNALYDKQVEEFSFTPFTIRVYFEWYEGENELMDDEADSELGLTAANESTTFNVSASIVFEQIFE